MPAFPIRSLPRPAMSLLLAGGFALIAGAALAAPTAAPGYTLTPFANGADIGTISPDSIAIVGNDVFVGYGNGAATTGAGTSVIAEYSSTGTVLGTLVVAGHNDGLRYNSATGQLWALQNEDANPNLVLINPSTLATSAALPFSDVPAGGGYDDVAFGPSGAIYISASNPAANPNTAPAIVNVSLGATQVNVLGGVLAGNATANVINTPGTSTTLNLQDPDSLIFGPGGQLVLDSQADQELIFISNVGTAGQTQSVLKLPSSVDDTVFGNGTQEELLFADRDSNMVYALSGVFGAGQAFSAADALNEIVNVNQTNGSFTNLVTGLNSPHGEAFLTVAAVPEPATWTMLILGVAMVGLGLRRRRAGGPAVGDPLQTIR